MRLTAAAILLLFTVGAVSAEPVAVDRLLTTRSGFDRGVPGPVASFWLGQPRGLTVDRGGNIYVADDSTVHRIDAATGWVTRVAGTGEENFIDDDGGPATLAHLSGISSHGGAGLALDETGGGTVLYIADSVGGKIRAVNLGGAEVRVANLTIAPGAIRTIAGNGRFSMDGADGVLATKSTLAWPAGVVVDPVGDAVFFTDSHSGKVRRIDRTTGIITTLAADTGCGSGDQPYCLTGGISFDPTFTALYVTEWVNWSTGAVRRFDRDGHITTFVAAGALGPRPGNITFDPAGNAFIGDSENGLIVRVDATTGILTHFAGRGPAGCQSEPFDAGDSGGPALDAYLSNPDELIFRNGKLYVGELCNSALRVIDGSGTITDIGGRAGLRSVFAAAFAGDDLLVAGGPDPRLSRVDRSGRVTVVLEDAGRPASIAVAVSGDVYLAARAPEGGTIQRLPHGAPPLQLVATLDFAPLGLALDGSTLYIGEEFGSRLYALDLATHGVTQLLAPGEAHAIVGVAHDAARGALYLADIDAGVVRRLDLTTSPPALSTLIELPPPCSQHWGCRSAPLFLTMTGDFLFVTDDSAGYLWRLDLDDPEGTLTRVTRRDWDVPRFYGDNVEASASLLDFPTALAVDGDGKLHVLETGGDRVRRLGMVDIMPGVFPNRIPADRPTFEVAILATHDFDPLAEVDPSTIRVAGAAPAGVSTARDVDGDQRIDLVVRVATQRLQLARGAKEAEVTFTTRAGQLLSDGDWITR